MSERHESRAIVVTVPKTEQDHVLNEKFLDTVNQIYWSLRQVPAHPVDRVYFVWDGAVRAWREAIGFDDDESYGEGPLVWLGSEHHKVEPPVPMDSFRGYHWFDPTESMEVPE